MLLTLDIGNTNICIGVFQGKKLIHHWKIRTTNHSTHDENAVMLLNLLSRTRLKTEDIKEIIVSSVVPPLTPVFQMACRDLFNRRPLIVGPGLKTGMPILYENPQEVGADRIVAAVAAFERYGGPCLVVDFGIATTFDAVSKRGEYLGGAIAPGIQIAAEALASKTAKLPHVEVKKPKICIGRTTVDSMQAGLYFGYIGLVTNIIKAMKKELGNESRVVSTGGWGIQIHDEIDEISDYEPYLVMEGLRILFERNRS
jgi:type III pantothenate kinase